MGIAEEEEDEEETEDIEEVEEFSPVLGASVEVMEENIAGVQTPEAEAKKGEEAGLGGGLLLTKLAEAEAEKKVIA